MVKEKLYRALSPKNLPRKILPDITCSGQGSATIASMRPLVVKLPFSLKTWGLPQSLTELAACSNVKLVSASSFYPCWLLFTRHLMLYSPKCDSGSAGETEGGTILTETYGSANPGFVFDFKPNSIESEAAIHYMLHPDIRKKRARFIDPATGN